MGLLGNITGGLFGETKGTEQTVRDQTPAEYEAFRGPIASIIAALAGATGPIQGERPLPGTNEFATINPASNVLAGIPSTPADLLKTAPLSKQERNALGLINQQLNQQGNINIQGPAPAGALTRQARGEIGDVIRGEYLDPNNPITRAMIDAAQRPVREALLEDLERALPGRFTQAGQFVQPQGSSAFDRAAALATRGAANALGDISSKIQYASHDAERNRMMDALGYAQENERTGLAREELGQRGSVAQAQINAQEMQNTIQGLQALALPRMIKEMGLEKGLADFDKRMNFLLQWLNPVLGAGAAQPVVTTKGGGSTPGFLGGASQVFANVFPGGATKSGTLLS